MRKRAGTALSILMTVFGCGVSAPFAAPSEFECRDTPADAVLTLPQPLAKWGRISCTVYGHVLTNNEGWIWISPASRQAVFVPSQLIDGLPEPLGNKSYFTKIEVAPAKNEEFDKAYAIFHEGFDEKEAKPDGYRADLTSVSGKTMRLYFFDYTTYAWGMWCPDNDCSADTRFMILDRARRPEPRQPPI